MKRRRVSGDSTVSSLSRNSGVPEAFAPGTINSASTTTVANWWASKVVGTKGAALLAAAGFRVCAATAAACWCTWSALASANPGTASEAPSPAASVCSAERRDRPPSGEGWMTGSVRPSFMRGTPPW